MERLYSRKRYLGGVIKFEEYKKLSRRIRERDKRSSKMSRKEKRKAEGDKGRVESRSGGVQEE